MVAISLTQENVKEMANRLRQFLAAGGTSIKQTHAYEALAKAFGYRDWNTLLGALQSADPASQDVDAKESGAASVAAPALPAMLLLIDRHAMAAHGVTMSHIEAAFRREFPALLETKRERETLCHEQLPLRQLPAFSPPALSLLLRTPENAHVGDAVMECVRTVAEPKWIFAQHVRAETTKFTVMFFPERDVETLLPAMKEALRTLPTGATLLSIEKADTLADHPEGNWKADGVSYYVWAWDSDMMIPKQLQIASMALKFNADVLIRLRDVATLHAGMRRVPGGQE